MTPTYARTAANGRVIKIDRRGMVKFALGDGDPVELDAVAVYDQWWEIDRNFRDESGEVPKEHLAERSMAMWRFVSGIFNPPEGGPKLTMTEVLSFMKLLAQEVDRLRGFFDDSTSEEASSPESSDRTSSA